MQLWKIMLPLCCSIQEKWNYIWQINFGIDFVRVQTDYFDGFAVFSKTEHAYDFIKYYYNRDCVKINNRALIFYALMKIYTMKKWHIWLVFTWMPIVYGQI